MKKSLIFWTLSSVCILVLLGVSPSGWSAELYIAPDGSDHNPGTIEAPFASLEKARDTVREWKKNEATPSAHTIYLRDGKYFLNQSFHLTEADAGTPDAPITYQAYPGEAPRLIGGRAIDPAWFQPVPPEAEAWSRLDPVARGEVHFVYLPKYGITEYGKLRVRGFAKPHEPSHMELICNDQVMQLARWPNSGFVRTATAESDSTFVYQGDRPSRWLHASDPWTFGYFHHGWADEYRAIQTIDPKKKTITLDGDSVYGIKNDKGWYALNLLEELDAPGEYYIDRETGTLYFWPACDLLQAELFVSTLGEQGEPLILAENTANLTFQDLHLEAGRADGIVIKGGDSIQVQGGTIRNMGSCGVVFEGIACGIRQTEITGVGAGGVVLTGGDRHELLPANNFTEHCTIHNFSRWSRTYNPAIQINGVGNRAAHNRIYNGPHSGILFGGNNHVMEFNDISRCCQETDDAGSLYGGRDWGARGNQIRYNFFHDIASSLVGSLGVHAVYLDDCISGISVYGNIFYNISGRAVMCGGGRDNLIENNVIVQCGAAHFTDRRGKAWVVDTPGDSWDLLGKIKRYNYDQPPWSIEYPELATILDNGYEQAKEPEGCVIRTNIGFQNKKWLEKNCLGACDGFSFYTITNNIEEEDPRFVDPENGNFRLRDDSPAYRLKGFQPIPFEFIGPWK